ncbi:acetate kinase [Capnocytophaga haemolytica]|uniref:Acetate kinase n=1 Tax=Capnocytophaga haemolytica TaxID=45243 RepID=A0AAX2GUJ8_9FLAO|nr:acetate kinase [Capnocytophaga haemolytica]AMD85374.1 acetate kinase [Capnocytophaga haemolytica]SFO13620.1 acetate kinase [Capnocytophaga haemolytica]SNV02341.1 Acetate kinase [Capnocytophaga haemolytica]
MEILIINSGSSSLKYQLIDSKTGVSHARGLVDRIGIDGSTIKYIALKNGKEVEVKREVAIPTHEVGMNLVAELLTDKEVGVISNPSEIKGVGHRVVHGGETLVQPTVITDEVVSKIEQLIPLSPLHNPGHLEGIRVARKLFSNATHVAVFDTAFHQTMPAKAFRYAIPNEYYEKHGVRAYGFHGTSHKYVDAQARKYLNNPHLKNITIHLGNGASMAAVNVEGHCVDTSMGLTPLDGLIMGTRCGLIDASVVFFLNEELGLSNEEIKTIFNKKSGMLGLTGNSDARDVSAKYHKGDVEAILCYEMYAYRIQKFIGAYTAALNGLDSIVFTAGVGENDALTRSLVCKNMEFFGIKLDEEKNVSRNHPTEPVEIQATDSRVKILVIPTNEELQIVNEIVNLV